jgi:hypothetical protein
MLAEDRFPTIWLPSKDLLDLRSLLLHRHQWVRMRTRIQNALQAIALANGLRRGPGRAAAEDKAMTGGDLQQICIDSSAESKAGCPFYLLGITQGISMGMVIADGKTQGGRPCVPDNLSASA